MKRHSLQRKIIVSSSLIVLLSLVMVLVGAIGISRSKQFSAGILPLTQELSDLKLFNAHLESLDRDLEEFFVTGSQFLAGKVLALLSHMDDPMTSLHSINSHAESIHRLDELLGILSGNIEALLGDTPLSSRRQNELVVSTFDVLRDIGATHQILTDANLDEISNHMAAQQDTIRLAVLLVVLFGAAITAAFLIFGFRLSYHISNSILSIKQAAARIAGGDLDSRVHVNSKDEIGELADDLNSMVVQLQESMRALQASEEQFRLIASQVPGIVFQVLIRPGRNYQFRFVSPRFTQMLGVPTDSWSEDLVRFVHPDHLRSFRVSWIRAIRDRDEWHQEFCLITLDNNERWFSGMAAPGESEDELMYTGILLDITEKKRAELDLIDVLETKSLLMTEMHHRVKNNLQIVSSLIRIEASLGRDERVARQMQNTALRVQAMGLLHEQLYQHDNLSSIQAPVFFGALVEQVYNVYRTEDLNVTIVYDIDDLSLNSETAMPCGFILNEIVTNSLKHAFGNGSGGEIGVSLKKRDDLLVMVVYDDGKGLEPGIDFRNNRGLGLQMIDMLAKQLHGSVKIDRTKGTKFTLELRRDFKEEKRWRRSGS